MAAPDRAEWRSICDKFSSAQRLAETRSDPDTDPFRSKYRARELLGEIYRALKSFEAGDGEAEGAEELAGGTAELFQGLNLVDAGTGAVAGLSGAGLSGTGLSGAGLSEAGLRAARLGAVELFLGLNHVETEELSAGEEHLMNGLKLLDTCVVSPENVSLFIQIRNQLGILWAGREETEKAQGFLETAQNIYLQYMKEDGTPPMDATEYFTTEPHSLPAQERNKRFELGYTHTLYYLAQVYKNLGEFERSASYCHGTLQRQLQLNQYNPLDWAINAATLSQYYITKGQYMEGRHCLSAATVVSEQAGETPSEAAAQESEVESERRDQLRQKRAEIARCWIKYCLNLLQDAKKLLEDNIGEMDVDRQEELRRMRRTEEEEEKRKTAVLFGSEDTFHSIVSLEEKVSCLLPLDFTEARAVFLVGQNYVIQAKEYFEMDGHVTDHIEIVQDHSALFKALAFFESDIERRCKMHKRRVDMLEPICKELNTQYYLLISRQLMFELAETYYELMDLKDLLNRQMDHVPDSHNIKKFNHLCSCSTKYYQMFVDSLRSREGKFPDRLDGEVLRPTLVARFRMARLYSRLISSGASAQLDNLNQSLQNYQFVVQYCQDHPDAAVAVETELELSQDMVGLLPIKIQRIKAKMATNN